MGLKKPIPNIFQLLVGFIFFLSKHLPEYQHGIKIDILPCARDSLSFCYG